METQAAKPQSRRENVSGAIRIRYSETQSEVCRMSQLVKFNPVSRLQRTKVVTKILNLAHRSHSAAYGTRNGLLQNCHSLGENAFRTSLVSVIVLLVDFQIIQDPSLRNTETVLICFSTNSFQIPALDLFILQPIFIYPYYGQSKYNVQMLGID